MHSAAAPAPTGHDAFDYVTLGIAALGAVTGLMALGATWFQFVLSAPRIKVTLGSGLNTGNGLWGISVNATNVGRTAATIDGVGLRLGRGSKAPHIPFAMELLTGRAEGPPLPLRLEPYASASWWISAGVTLEAVGQLERQRRPARVTAFATFGRDEAIADKPFTVAYVSKLASW